jgi:hypothetical protein
MAPAPTRRHQRLAVADGEGWLASPATGARLRVEAGQKLALQFGGDFSTRRLLPE